MIIPMAKLNANIIPTESGIDEEPKNFKEIKVEFCRETTAIAPAKRPTIKQVRIGGINFMANG